MFPAGAWRDANVAFSRVAAGRDAKAVRPDETSSMSADEGEQLALPLEPFGADLGEPGRDHD